MKKKNMGVNAVLNVIRQGLSVVFPLITYPYALRTLGVESIGKVNYASSIVSYFSLIAMLGVTTYAVREGAKRKDNKKEFEKFVSETFTINMIFTGIAYILLVICLLVVKELSDYSLLILLSSSSIVMTTLSVDWINTIFEDFLVITVRSIVAHIVSLAILFLFVHSPEDYYIYALLSVSSVAVTCFTNIFYVRRYVKVRLTLHPNFKTHMVPLLVLFANNLAISIYTNSDTTMIGWMKGDYYVGLYSVSVKVYNIVKNILIAVYSVAIPRLAYYVGERKENEYKKLISDLWCYLALILIPCGIGLIITAPEIMMFMGGEEYTEAVLSLQILGAALIFAIFGGIVTVCMNVSLGREKENLKATIIAAILNFGFNLVLIPKFAQNGAAATTLMAEIFVLVFCFVRIPHKSRYMSYGIVGRTGIHAIIGSAVMCIYAYLIRGFFDRYMVRLAVIVAGCVVIYTVVLVLFRDKYLMDAVKIGLNKVKRKK